MASTELIPTAWSRYLARISSERAGAPTSVVLTGARGRVADGETVTRPLIGIGFEPVSACLELRVAGARGAPAVSFFLDRPRRLLAADVGDARELLVIDASGAQTLIRVGAARRTRAHRRIARRPCCGPSRARGGERRGRRR